MIPFHVKRTVSGIYCFSIIDKSQCINQDQMLIYKADFQSRQTIFTRVPTYGELVWIHQTSNKFWFYSVKPRKNQDSYLPVTKMFGIYGFLILWHLMDRKIKACKLKNKIYQVFWILLFLSSSNRASSSLNLRNQTSQINYVCVECLIITGCFRSLNCTRSKPLFTFNGLIILYKFKFNSLSDHW